MTIKIKDDEWLIEGQTIYTLQECTWLGKPSFENAISAHFTRGRGVPIEKAQAAANTARAALNHIDALAEALRTVLGYDDGTWHNQRAVLAAYDAAMKEVNSDD